VHGFKLCKIFAGGGGAKSVIWMQIHSDILGSSIQLAREPECTALGAAIWAGIGSRQFNNYDDAIKHMVRLGKIIKPNISNKDTYDFYYNQYKKTYMALKPLMHTMASFQNHEIDSMLAQEKNDNTL
jgi:sugar (pentulose or hexulose) kinase